MAAALAVGQRFWGSVPCKGGIRVDTRARPTGTVAPDSDAWVTFGSPLGSNDLAADPATYTACRIAFGLRRWPTAASMVADWDIFCATAVHELGHLLGRRHDDTPGSVMTTVFTDLASVPALCRSARPARSRAA